MGPTGNRRGQADKRVLCAWWQRLNEEDGDDRLASTAVGLRADMGVRSHAMRHCGMSGELQHNGLRDIHQEARISFVVPGEGV